MTLWTLVRRSLLYYHRMHFVVATGVAAATAVLVGALLVGDTVRQSLVSLTEERLGSIDYLVTARTFFRQDRLSHWAGDPEIKKQFPLAAGAIVIPRTTLVHQESSQQVSRVTVLATEAAFWDLRASGTPLPKRLPGEDEIIVNQTLADDLGVRVGELVALRLPDAGAIPADSPFGDKSDVVRRVPELEVIEILPDAGFGKFQLNPSQRPPRNAFVSLDHLQQSLD